MYQKTHYTKKQLEVENWINNLGFQTELEKVYGKFCADIFIPELNWIIEVDGMGHWKKKDEKRDNYLYENFGIDHIIHVKSDIRKEQFRQVFLDNIERKFKDAGFEKGN